MQQSDRTPEDGQPAQRGQPPEYDLGHHGDVDATPGLVDLAVNVRVGEPPHWLLAPVRASLGDLARYPDQRPARAAVAARHTRPPDEVLLTAGAAQGFVLLAQALRDARHPVVVHPQFTEPEAALRAAGHRVDRVLLRPDTGFTLDPARIPADADLVFIGNPTNPTSVLHPADTIAALTRPGRTVVVDEAFADTTCAAGVPGEPQSLADRRDLPGLVVVRSLTKTWALAGLRIGYLLGPAALLARLAAVAPLWPVATPALVAAEICASRRAVGAERRYAATLAADRGHLLRRLRELPGVTVAGTPASAFVLLHLVGADQVRRRLRQQGWAVRRGDTFPGLGPDWLRVAVRDTATTDAFVHVLRATLED
ncbi:MULTISPECIES: Rv2231c family pyridoxal phosphate-dependent protein CobC [unclassified Solwaraspora]|uniref:Rv2231c family pyridoxal phosphate-dependent protein CobC n=1 Tax=unclassified Solwaraspora TaxID=2627926 RepID=UPI00259B0CE6|nr:Rv2231c family pyridoxal phosphate-dependent protein CobC [Solwaraspora sp. WMMA2056]WJK43115.1 Rv2231c family pyridoxal phosphate-dependent protein CobC [Solwaraspora sp. WMMA2056]